MVTQNMVSTHEGKSIFSGKSQICDNYFFITLGPGGGGVKTLYAHMLPLKFSILRMLGLKNPQNLTFKNQIKTKIFSDYFPKFSSEINSTLPFNPILIPNTSYVKKIFRIRIRPLSKCRSGSVPKTQICKPAFE